MSAGQIAAQTAAAPAESALPQAGCLHRHDHSGGAWTCPCAADAARCSFAADHPDDLPRAACVLAVAELIRADWIDRFGRDEPDLAARRDDAHEILARV